MATSNASVSVLEKRNLENTPMYAHRVRGSHQKTSIHIRVQIDKFTQLKDNTVHTTEIRKLSWKLSVIRKRKTATLIIRTLGGCDYRMECFVCYNHRLTSSLVEVNKISEDKYVIELSSEKVHNPNNVRLLVVGYLCCKIYISPCLYMGMVCPFTGVKVFKKSRLTSFAEVRLEKESDKIEEGVIAENMKGISTDLQFTDFKICLQTTDKLSAHKAILAARSKFFYDYLNENEGKEEIQLVTTREALFVAIQFMYFGAIYVQPLDTMIAVFELAVKLKMKSLQNVCVAYLKQIINVANVQLIRKVGSRNGMEDLVSAADEFLKSDEATRATGRLRRKGKNA